MNKTKQERVDTMNNLIEFISNRGRRFFHTNTTYDNSKTDSVAYIKLKNGRIHLVDNYTLKDIPVINNHREWDGFSHGGTLKALVLDFAEFIRTGKYSNGNNGYRGLHSSGWGHSEEIQIEIVKYATEIGYL